MRTSYDTIIVGARAAGAATAMLLAQSGQRVLAIDKAAYRSDTLSTHALMRGAVDSLSRWGLLDTVLASDTPVIRNTTFCYGAETVTVEIKPIPGVPGLVAPRRTVLDPILVDAARSAGAVVRHETALVDLVLVDGRVCGVTVEHPDGCIETLSAGLVVGADGLRSKVARLVDASITHQGTASSAYIMKYFDDLDVERDTFAWSYDIGIGSGIIPTSDGRTCVFASMDPSAFRHHGRRDIEGSFERIVTKLNPTVGAQLPTVGQNGPTRSWPGIPGHFRKPSGPGWALVGDAGYFKDPFAAHGISDAFRDAELLAEAAIAGDFAMYEAVRDVNSVPLFNALEKLASYEWDLTTLPGIHFEISKAMKAEGKALAAHRSNPLLKAA